MMLASWWVCEYETHLTFSLTHSESFKIGIWTNPFVDLLLIKNFFKVQREITKGFPLKDKTWFTATCSRKFPTPSTLRLAWGFSSTFLQSLEMILAFITLHLTDFLFTSSTRLKFFNQKPYYACICIANPQHGACHKDKCSACSSFHHS